MDRTGGVVVSYGAEVSGGVRGGGGRACSRNQIAVRSSLDQVGRLGLGRLGLGGAPFMVRGTEREREVDTGRDKQGL